MSNARTETFVEKNVTYSIELDGKLYLIEHVPARVCLETGEQFYSPETVERVHSIIRGERGGPKRIEQTPVFDFAA